jgi:mRNA interferase RelE/StbE
VTFKVEWRDEARQTFLRLDKAIQERVRRVVDRLAENPRPAQATPLVGDPHTLRVRSGAWRILYEIHDDQLVVLVLNLDHRSRAYGGH